MDDMMHNSDLHCSRCGRYATRDPCDTCIGKYGLDVGETDGCIEYDKIDGSPTFTGETPPTTEEPPKKFRWPWSRRRG